MQPPELDVDPELTDRNTVLGTPARRTPTATRDAGCQRRIQGSPVDTGLPAGNDA